MAKLGVAILGQGRSGWSIHARHLLRDERFRVLAVVDRLAERRARGGAAFHCPGLGDYEELRGLSGLDLIVNALPSPYHYPVTKRLLGWGYNVLSEKPAAGTPVEIDEMEAAARQSGAKLAFFQQSRFAPYFTHIQKVLASGVLGRIVQISIAFDGFGRRWDWQTIQDMRGGSLYNTGPHPLDQALALLEQDQELTRQSGEGFSSAGGADTGCPRIEARRQARLPRRSGGEGALEVRRADSDAAAGEKTSRAVAGIPGIALGGEEMPNVFCRMERALVSGDAEDYVKLLLTMPGRPLVDLSISSLNAYPRETYHIQGTRGGLISDTKSVSWRWFDPAEAPERPLIRLPLTAPDGEPAYCGETLPWREDRWEAGPGEDAFTFAVDALYGELYRHLTENAPLTVTTAQVRRQIAVIAECHRQNPLDRMV